MIVSWKMRQMKTLHICDSFIEQVSNGKTYRFENVAVKNFQGNAHLSTTSSSTFREEKQVVESFVGSKLLESKEMEITIDQFELVNKLDIFLACQSCKRKIDEDGKSF